MAECLFFLFFCDPAGAASPAVASLVRQGQLQQLLKLLDAHFTLEESLLHEAVFIVALAVQSLFVWTLMGGQQQQQQQEDGLLTGALLEQLDEQLLRLGNKEARALLQLAFGVLVRRRGAAVSSVAAEMSAANFARATGGEALGTLAGLLDHPSYGHDDGAEA